MFYHAHQLGRVSAQPETCVSCNFCTKPIVKEFYVCKLCKFTVHPMCAMHPQRLWHVVHKHKLTLVPPSTQNMISCAGCNTLAPGFRYTCVPCDFNLHPSCAVLPPKPLCIFDGGHRVAIHSQQANFECARCFKAGCSWSYICDEVHHVHMHLHCANDTMDSAAKVNMISEHLDVLMRKKVQIESSGNNQRSPSPTSHQQQRIQGMKCSHFHNNSRAFGIVDERRLKECEFQQELRRRNRVRRSTPLQRVRRTWYQRWQKICA